MIRWSPTHALVLTRPDGTWQRIRVQLEESPEGGGFAYTLEEWNYCESADWEVDEDGTWTFQGQAVPPGFVSVEVQVLP